MGLTISVGAAHCAQSHTDYRAVVDFSLIRTAFEQHRTEYRDDDV